MPARTRKKCVVVGVGNPQMRDDGIGIEVPRALRKSSPGSAVLDLERQTLDISILDQAKGASKLVVVDAIKSGRPPGSVVKFSLGRPGSPTLRAPLSHEQDFNDILALAQKSGMRQPPVVVVGVEPEDCTLGEGLSTTVAGALPRVLEEVEAEVKEVSGG